MITYMIRHEEPVNSFMEPIFGGEGWDRAFRPREGFDTEESADWYAVLVRGETSITIESSGIGVGIQVTFEGPIDDAEAERIVGMFVERVGEEVGVPVVSVRLPEDKIIRWTR